MTEDDWLGSRLARPLLVHMHNKASPRKLRLFACACERRIAKYRRAKPMDFEVAADLAIAAAERHAEGEGPAGALKEAFDSVESGMPGRDCTRSAPIQAAKESQNSAYWRIYWFSKLPKDEKEAQRGVFADLARCILGNPFRPPPKVSTWPTSAISLALAAYEERQMPSGELDPARLAVLSDALEEAGISGDILSHLRSPGPHVRGCWAIDLILGKK